MYNPDHTDKTYQPPTGPAAPSEVMTLRDLIAYIQAANNLRHRQKREMTSALRVVCRVLNASPGDVMASPHSLRARLENAPYALAGIQKQRWYAIRTQTLTALRAAGFKVMPGRRTKEPLSCPWYELRDQLPDTRYRHALSRFMSFCTAEQIAPTSVDKSVFVRFHDALENNSLVRQAPWIYRNTCIHWNKASRDIAAWPKLELEVPSFSRRYSLDWSDFPASFQLDVKNYLTQTGSEDPLADNYVKAARPATIKNRRTLIRQIATATVSPEYPAENVTSLAKLVEPANAKRALRFFLDRVGNVKSANLYNHALLLRTIARHWVQAPKEQVAELETWCKRLCVTEHGMKPRNRARLRQFDDPANLSAFLDLPSRLVRRAKRMDKGRRHDAALVLFALAIELLTIAPMRIKNLTELEVERHFVRPRIGAKSTVHLVIPGAETKTGEPYEMELPKQATDLLNLYLKTYRPRLTSEPSKWLFPNARGRQRNVVSFGQQIGKIVLRETGIQLHVHLFRHLAVKLHLEAHPEDVETPRRFLGHKSLRTTLRAYADLKSAAAFKRYDGLIASLRAEGRTRLPKAANTRNRGAML